MKEAGCAQDWLYEEGEDESKGVYEAKLKELQALGEPLRLRAHEAQARPAAAAALTSTANRIIAVATANDAKHAHIPQDDKDKVCLCAFIKDVYKHRPVMSKRFRVPTQRSMHSSTEPQCLPWVSLLIRLQYRAW